MPRATSAMILRRTFIGATVVVALAVTAPGLRAQTLLAPEEAAKTIAIENLNLQPEGVNGVVVNRSPHIIRDTEIMVQYHWRWENEFKPGPNAPGETVIVRLPNELRPGESAPFRHTLTKPVDRKDGRFAPEVTIAGFTVVVPPK